MTAQPIHHQILISNVAFQRFADAIIRVDPAARFLRPDPDAGLLDNHGAVAPPTAAPTIAWLTPDMLYDGSRSSFFGIIGRSHSLEWVQSSFAGLDLPIYRDLLERGCRVTSSHENGISIAEYVIGAVLRLYQQPDRWSNAQHTYSWQHHEFPELHATNWLIVGFGAIGQATAKRARGFGVAVTAVRRAPRGDEGVERVLRQDELHDALPQADVVVLALPGTPETDNLVNDAFLTAMKDTAILVNVARGSLIDDEALLRVLDRRENLRCVLDVFREEPLPGDSPFWAHPQIVVTPHASSGGLGRHARNAALFTRNFRAFMDRRGLENEVSLADLPVRRADSVPAQFQ